MFLRKYKKFRSLITQLNRLPVIEAKLRELDHKIDANHKSDLQDQTPLKEVDSIPTTRTDYQSWMDSIVIGNPAKPEFWLYSSWFPDTPYYQLIVNASMEAEFLYAKDLITDINFKKIAGAVVEFGVFEGLWLSHLAEVMEENGINREIWGFDSFQGLPDTTEHDLDCWSEGQFSANYDEVSKRLKCDQRQHIHLVKGWFSDTFKLPDVQAIDKIAFTRIDCDLYEPAVECLEFLETRLVDGAILVFDDWTWDLEKGETKAFKEWVEKGCGFQFEFLSYNCNGHLYLRVKK